VLAGQRPGGTVSAVARAYEFATGTLFRWRVELGIAGRGKPASVKFAGGASGDSRTLSPVPLVSRTCCR
jgi:transposase-like protein